MLLRTFSAIFLVSLSSCGKGPKVAVCAYHQPTQEFVCVDKNGKDFDMAATNSMANNLVCLPRADAEEYFKWCNRK